MQCSRFPRALTTSPLTQARRAAWRRSERRRRSQRRKKAHARQSAGRRSKRAASQSSTSNVDDCVTRAGASRRAVSASRSRFGTAGSGGRLEGVGETRVFRVLGKPRPGDMGVRGFSLHRWQVASATGAIPHLTDALGTIPRACQPRSLLSLSINSAPASPGRGERTKLFVRSDSHTAPLLAILPDPP
jgi:hypothetical protein